MLRAWTITVSSAIAVGLLNAALRAAGIDANYMYLCERPRADTLFNYFGPWPWSLVTLLLVGTLIFGVLNLPHWLLDRRPRQQAPTPSRAADAATIIGP
jgi:uncharacterized membrane protein YwaF